jgi:Holliday junction resolvase RusA-like endonuclease
VSDDTTVGRLVISVTGRPAPQGSKKTGAAGQLREQSAYLPAWRAAVKRAAYERYRELDVLPDQLPLLRGPVAVSVVFRMPADRRPDAPPDLDKLLRSTWDALTGARVWEDDGRVVRVESEKVRVGPGVATGADIEIWSV